jgi:hypothetical protein
MTVVEILNSMNEIFKKHLIAPRKQDCEAAKSALRKIQPAEQDNPGIHLRPRDTYRIPEMLLPHLQLQRTIIQKLKDFYACRVQYALRKVKS